MAAMDESLPRPKGAAWRATWGALLAVSLTASVQPDWFVSPWARSALVLLGLICAVSDLLRLESRQLLRRPLMQLIRHVQRERGAGGDALLGLLAATSWAIAIVICFTP
ncbi:hypothetical protein CKO37_22930 [Rubrivivax gelatinosus]|nr:hypothetical protein [Rubrivivax gelatinosus]